MHMLLAASALVAVTEVKPDWAPGEGFTPFSAIAAEFVSEWSHEAQDSALTDCIRLMDPFHWSNQGAYIMDLPSDLLSSTEYDCFIARHAGFPIDWLEGDLGESHRRFYSQDTGVANMEWRNVQRLMERGLY